MNNFNPNQSSPDASRNRRAIRQFIERVQSGAPPEELRAWLTVHVYDFEQPLRGKLAQAFDIQIESLAAQQDSARNGGGA